MDSNFSMRQRFSFVSIVLFFFCGLRPIEASNSDFFAYPLEPSSENSFLPLSNDCHDSDIDYLFGQLSNHSHDFEKSGGKIGYLFSRLDKCGKKIIPKLAGLLSSQDRELVEKTLFLLRGADTGLESVVPELIALLQHPDEKIRRNVVEILAKCGSSAINVADSLTPLLDDANEQVVVAVLGALSEIGIKTNEAVSKIIQSYRVYKRNGEDYYDEVFIMALLKQGKMGLLSIFQLLNDPDEIIRGSIASFFDMVMVGFVYEETKYISENEVKLDSDEIATLLTLLNDPVVENQQIAAIILGIFKKNANSKIIMALKNKLQDEPTCNVAAGALGEFGILSVSVMPSLIGILEKKESCRDSALKALTKIDEKNTGKLLADVLHRDNGYALQKLVLESLAKSINNGVDVGVPEDIAPLLMSTLRGNDASLASSAITILGTLGSDAKNAVPDLVKIIESKKEYSRVKGGASPVEVRDTATIALTRIGKNAVPNLKRVLSSPDKSTRHRALFALGAIGSDAREASVQIISLMGGNNKDTKLLAAITLAEIGMKADAVLPVLIKALHTEDLDVRGKIVAAIGKVGDAAEKVIPELIKIIGQDGVSSKDREVRDKAIQALKDIGKPAVPALVIALGNGNKMISANSMKALVGIGQDAVPELSLALENSDEEVRRGAAFTLGQIGGEQVISILMANLKKDNTMIRELSIYALGVINAPSYDLMNILTHIVNNEQDHSVNERRIAASVAEIFGADFSWFFEKNDFLNPDSTFCYPVDASFGGFESGVFDIYSGECWSNDEGVVKTAAEKAAATKAGGRSLVSMLCGFFGCK